MYVTNIAVTYSEFQFFFVIGQYLSPTVDESLKLTFHLKHEQCMSMMWKFKLVAISEKQLNFFYK